MLKTIHDEFGTWEATGQARLQYDAFQVAVAHGDIARASIFAQRAYQARMVCEGEDSSET